MNIKVNQTFPHIKFVKLWDLDGTVIDSFHRVKPCFDEEGNLNLAKYMKEATTHEKIQADTMLPLVEYMRQSMNAKDTANLICTARLMRKSDYYFLRKQSLRGRGDTNIRILSRDVLSRYFELEDVPRIYSSRDADYKTAYFRWVKATYPNAEITMIDDNQSVLKAAADFGLMTLDATALNDILSIGIKLGSEQLLDETIWDDEDFGYLKQRLEFCWQGLTQEEREEYSVNPNGFLQQLQAS